MIHTITPLHMQALRLLHDGRQLPVLTVKAVAAKLIDEGFAELEHGELGEVLAITEAGRAVVEATRQRTDGFSDEPPASPPAWKRTTDEQPAPDPLERHTARLVCNQISVAVLGLMLALVCAFGIGFQLKLLRDEVKKNNAAVAEVLVKSNACVEALRLAVKVQADPRVLPDPVPVVSSRETGPEDLIPLLPFPRK